jgi:hypothetical protein
MVRDAQRRLHGESPFERTGQFSKSPAMFAERDSQRSAEVRGARRDG